RLGAGRPVPRQKRAGNQQLTSPPTLLAFDPVARRVSLRSHSLTPLSHIALASEPAYILVAGSLYRLGQRRRWPTVTCKFFSKTLVWCAPGPPAVGRIY